MSKTKIGMVLVAVAALALVLVGLASAQVAATQNVTGATSNTAPNSGGVFGWIGRCFGYGTTPYYGTQGQVAPSVPANTTVQSPYVNTPPVQGNYWYGRGCMGRYLP